MNAIIIVFSLIIGYLIGSIPWPLIIGKIFYKKDIRNYQIRQYNLKRLVQLLDVKAAIIIEILDAFKPLCTVLILSKFTSDINAFAFGGLSTCIGEYYQVAQRFIGSKAMPTTFMYLLCLGIFVTKDIVFIFVCPLLAYLLVLGLVRYTSISSIFSLIVATIIGFLTFKVDLYAYLVLILTFFVLFNHKDSLYLIFTKKEKKVTWLK